MPNLPSLPKLLPDSTGRTNDITAITEKSHPYLSKSANGRQLCCPGGRATQVTQGEKIERRKKKTRACYGVCVKQTRISTRLYQLNQYLWIEHSQVLQQVECRTANFSVAPLKIIPFFSLRSTSIEFPALLFALLITWKKVNPRVIFILIFALIVVFTLVVPDGFAQ